MNRINNLKKHDILAKRTGLKLAILVLFVPKQEPVFWDDSQR